MKLLSMHFFQPPNISCHLGPNIPLSTLFSKHHQSMVFPWRVRDQVSNPYKAASKITLFVF
jgi:hypothetical protein